MSILDASILFTRANNLRAQLDYISGHKNVEGADLLEFNNLIRLLDKIYISTNTKAHRIELKMFITTHGEYIYSKFVKLSDEKFDTDSYVENEKLTLRL